MATLHQTIKVPVDRRVTVELPEEMHPGSIAELTVIVSRIPKKTTGEALSRFAGVFKNSVTFARDALEIQKELRSEW